MHLSPRDSEVENEAARLGDVGAGARDSGLGGHEGGANIEKVVGGAIDDVVSSATPRADAARSGRRSASGLFSTTTCSDSDTETSVGSARSRPGFYV